MTFRKLETCGKPVVAAINGTGARRRTRSRRSPAITASWPTIRRSSSVFPEAQVGLLPGGGGTQRLPRLIGAMAALPLHAGRQARRSANGAGHGASSHKVVPAGDLVAAREGLDQGQARSGAALGQEGFQAFPAAGRSRPAARRSSPSATPCCARRPTTIIRRSASSCRRSMKACWCRYRYGAAASRRAISSSVLIDARQPQHDPHAVPFDAGAGQGRAPPGERSRRPM